MNMQNAVNLLIISHLVEPLNNSRSWHWSVSPKLFGACCLYYWKKKIKDIYVEIYSVVYLYNFQQFYSDIVR
jgi:hypothetical protein